jgi:hypothetical protein
VDVVPTNLLIIPNAWVPVVIAIFIPLLVSAVTHATASNRVRTVVGMFFAGITTILTQAIVGGGDAVITWETLRLFLLTTGVEILSYLGIKGLSNDTVNQRILPDTGFGKNPPA